MQSLGKLGCPFKESRVLVQEVLISFTRKNATVKGEL